MIRLDENDYEYLYPHFSPDEIKAIFGDYAHSSRHIYRIYKSMFKLPPMKARKEIEDVAHMCLADGEMSYSENFERTAYMTVLIRKNKIEEVWKKIKQREELNVYRNFDGTT
jgi:hypothetical protein